MTVSASWVWVFNGWPMAPKWRQEMCVAEICTPPTQESNTLPGLICEPYSVRACRWAWRSNSMCVRKLLLPAGSCGHMHRCTNNSRSKVNWVLRSKIIECRVDNEGTKKEHWRGEVGLPFQSPKNEDYITTFWHEGVVRETTYTREPYKFINFTCIVVCLRETTHTPSADSLLRVVVAVVSLYDHCEILVRSSEFSL